MIGPARIIQWLECPSGTGVEDGAGEHYTWSAERGSGHYPGSNDDRDRQRETCRIQDQEDPAWPGEPAHLSPKEQAKTLRLAWSGQAYDGPRRSQDMAWILSSPNLHSAVHSP